MKLHSTQLSLNIGNSSTQSHWHNPKDKGWSANKANVAADYECNITLAKEASNGLGIISMDTMKKTKAYVDKKYDGWGFERIYADCKDQYNDSQDNSMSGGDDIQQVADADYIKGWNQAIADWKAGKLKL